MISRRALSLSKRSLSTVVQPSPPQPWGILHALMPVVVPTTENFFPDIPSSSEGVPAKSFSLESSRLSNGVRVATLDHHGHASAVGIFVKGGNKVVSRDHAAVPHLVSAAAFKASKARSHFLTARKLEELGVNPLASVSRDQMGYTFESLRSNASEALAIVADSLTPRITDDNLHALAEQVKDDMKTHRETGTELITDALHAAAFRTGLSNPSVLSSVDINAVTVDDIAEFLSRNFVARNVVVAAHGVNHAEFVARASETALGGLDNTRVEFQEPHYIGGECNMHTDEDTGLASVAIGFQGPAWTSKDLPVYAVLQTLLGGGNSFSSGGPGKGMLSLLYRKLLVKHGWVESAVSYCAAYDSTAIFGVLGSCEAKYAERLVSLLAACIYELRVEVTDEELSRAKNQTAFGMLVALERRGAIVDDIARQLQSTGKYHTPQTFLSLIDKVTAYDIQRLVKMMSLSPVSFASVAPRPLTLTAKDVSDMLRR